MPPASPPPALTDLLHAWKGGEGAAFHRVVDLAYEQLKQIAVQRLRHRSQAVTLTPTELLHDALLRIADAPRDWKNRAHFFASMSLFIRSTLVDHARARAAAKRSDGAGDVTLSFVDAGEPSMAAELLAFDQALRRLEALDPRGAEVLHLTYFAGLDREQIAAVLGVSLSSVDRDLRFTRAWLREELELGR
ncbi:MAG TPA: ECF-type sigma factor [Tahibacter sp.]|uniref:ECF-type sigma factor n=1 Tax=Tahibacter sp. TaxID=2056211 RepID=UPI002BAC7761|nr:ECF-type sigma factor [Tahibacter sp.]HSX58924.1 ECF-type sigma factor [Tahibacter sp.]